MSNTGCLIDNICYNMTCDYILKMNLEMKRNVIALENFGTPEYELGCNLK